MNLLHFRSFLTLGYCYLCILSLLLPLSYPKHDALLVGHTSYPFIPSTLRYQPLLPVHNLSTLICSTNSSHLHFSPTRTSCGR
ncbi:hypothetical protein JAAARDRAFT_530289 [Jaapia argillacea MUCL 33604]|uniref:Uncharacterized protein n=1 Tax=Jaapia argillacea MUCL 33604 TaxID=933084 RepID=A0A067PM93_9AGAM|nr:hypothetical protein JAAARDRAFT_530289 [Jaapia argillacea MUCL 33604]